MSYPMGEPPGPIKTAITVIILVTAAAGALAGASIILKLYWVAIQFGWNLI